MAPEGVYVCVRGFYDSIDHLLTSVLLPFPLLGVAVAIRGPYRITSPQWWGRRATGFLTFTVNKGSLGKML